MGNLHAIWHHTVLPATWQRWETFCFSRPGMKMLVCVCAACACVCKLSLLYCLLHTPSAVTAVGFSLPFFRLFVRTISQKPMQLGSPNWTHKCYTRSPGNQYILGSKGQRQGQSQKTVPAWLFVLLWVTAFVMLSVVQLLQLVQVYRITSPDDFDGCKNFFFFL